MKGLKFRGDSTRKWTFFVETTVVLYLHTVYNNLNRSFSEYFDFSHYDKIR